MATLSRLNVSLSNELGTIDSGHYVHKKEDIWVLTKIRNAALDCMQTLLHVCVCMNAAPSIHCFQAWVDQHWQAYTHFLQRGLLYFPDT